MKNLLLILCLIAPPAYGQLPILVYSEDGSSAHVEKVEFELTGSADELYLQCHQCGYHKSDYADKVGYDRANEVRINGGDWIPLSNDQVNVAYPERVYGGIGGAYHTVRMTLPVNVSGKVVLEAKFNRSDGVRSGYRIIDLDFRRDGRSVLKKKTFDKPSSWQVEGNIIRGEQLFRKRNALVDNVISKGPIIAACADCHAKDGRDQKYFNYEPRVIEARSRFHGLSEEEARDIAAYIQSIDLDLPQGYTRDDAGRPWNPPYQPGPTLKDKPVDLWAAGAGLEWVLDRDGEMLPYLFPNGKTDIAHPDSSIRNDLIPMAVQFFDWSGWLPDVAPIDVYGPIVEQLPSYQDLDNRLPAEITQNREQFIRSMVPKRYRGRFGGLMSLHWTAGYGFEYAGEQTKIDVRARAPWNEPTQQLDELSEHQWQAVRMWELVQTHGLQDLGDEVFKAVRFLQDKSLIGGWDRTWIVSNQILFDLGPHKHAKPYYPKDSPYPTPETNVYATDVWYMLQMVLSNGNRWTVGTSPMDWNYTHPHIGNHVAHPRGGASRHNQFLRWMRSQITNQQVSNNFHGVTEKGHGWSTHTADPARILPGNEWSGVTVGAEPDMLADVAEAVLRAWMIKVSRHQISEFPRSSDCEAKNGGYPNSSCVPDDTGGYPNMSAQEKHSTFFTLLARLEGMGVDAGLISAAAEWGKAMWPRGNWERFMSVSPNIGAFKRINVPEASQPIQSP